jgi:hypothetical protein
MAGLSWIGVAIGVGAIVVLVVFYALLVRRVNRRSGGRGPVQRSRLTCVKCGQTFDYEWIPGAALTALRLGRSRYMACPLCHRWSTFDFAGSPVAPLSPPSHTGARAREDGQRPGG